MSTQTLTRRSWLQQSADGVRFSLHFILWVITWAAALVGTLLTFSPAVTTITTQHAVPYLPAHYEMVAGVTNVFTSRQLLGGAGGVGAPQVERSLSAYQKAERQETTHFLVVEVPAYPRDVIVDFFDFQVEKVIHASYTHRDSPPGWQRWGVRWGSFVPQSATVQDGGLVIQRVYDFAGKTTFLGVLVILVAMAAYAFWLRLLIDRHIFDRILPI